INTFYLMKLLTKTIIIIALTSVAAISVAGVFLYGAVRTNLQAQTAAAQLESSHQVLDKLDRFLYERQTDIQDLAAQPSLTKQRLADFKLLKASWQDLATLDTKQTTLAATNTADKTAGALAKHEQLTSL